MDLRIFTEPQQGASYDDLLHVAQATEALGFDAFFRSDHYLAMGVDGLPGPTDAWTTLAGLARETQRIRLGTLVSSMTFRWPGVLAIQVAQVDAMSEGRVELGLGAGWFEAEHRAYGIDFPDKRFDRLEEQLEIVTGLWATPLGKTYDFAGAHYRLEGSPALPKPVQSPLPVIVGGGGPRRTPALAARFAAEANVAFRPIGDVGEQFERLRAACRAAGRDPEDLVLSAAQVLCVGRYEAELRQRAEAIGRDVGQLRAEGAFVGAPAEVVERISAYGALGASRAYLQVLDLQDLDHLELVAAEVAPQLA